MAVFQMAVTRGLWRLP